MRITAEKYEEALELEHHFCVECEHITTEACCHECGEDCPTVEQAHYDGDVTIDDGDDEVGVISFSGDDDED